MKPPFFALLVASCWIAMAPTAYPASPGTSSVVVQAKVLSIATSHGGERLAPDASILLTLIPEGDQHHLTGKDNLWRLDAVATTRNSSGFDVRIEPSKLFSDRAFQLHRSTLGPLASELVFYVVGRDIVPAPSLSERFKFEPPSDFPAKVTVADQIGIDRAFAYFEDAVIKQKEVGGREVDPRLWVVDQYNYSVALYNACLLGYATCELASGTCGSLLDLLTKDAELSSHLSDAKYRDNLLLCRRLEFVRAAQEEWRVLKETYNRAIALRAPNQCQPEVADMLGAVADQAVRALQSYDERAADWRAVRIAKYAFARDAGVAQYARGEILSVCERGKNRASADSCEVLRSSLQLLGAAITEGDPWLTTSAAKTAAARKVRNCTPDA